jgi:hypothetical protein
MNAPRATYAALLVLALLQVCTATRGVAQTFLFEGQASLLEQLRATEPRTVTSDLRYIPTLSAETPLDEYRELSAELSVHAGYRVINEAEQRPAYERTAKLYRAWGRLSGPQWEARIGLQKISFGSAVLFRPLMWFDRLDPRDPLQITDGVPAVLARYSFLNNTNFWAWAVFGQGETRGWEALPSPRGKLEYGGRVQFPLFTGEGAISFHHRMANLQPVLPPGFPPPTELRLSEDRLGIDGKFDAGAGVWCEASLTRQHTDLLPAPWQQMLTLGADYSLSVADGFQVLAEYFIASASATALGNGSTSNVVAASGSLTLGLLDNVTAMLYLDLRGKDLYTFLDWRRTYDTWVFHLIGYWNPAGGGGSGLQGIPGWQSRSALAGGGGQIMVVFNH